MRFPKQEKSFAVNRNLLNIIALPDHDNAMSPDVLTSIQISKEWRSLIVAALQNFYFTGDSSLYLDNEDKLAAVISDLYTEEAFNSMAAKYVQYDLSANFSTNSTDFVTITGTIANFTPSKPNIAIQTVVQAFQSVVGIVASCRLVVDGAVGLDNAVSETPNSRTLIVGDRFSVTPNVALQIAIQMKCSNASQTAQMAGQIKNLYVIHEYD